MTRSRFVVEAVACLALLWAGAALATPTAEEKCQLARYQAWGVYLACQANAEGKFEAGLGVPDPSTAFQMAASKCRIRYAKMWTPTAKK